MPEAAGILGRPAGPDPGDPGRRLQSAAIYCPALAGGSTTPGLTRPGGNPIGQAGTVALPLEAVAACSPLRELAWLFPAASGKVGPDPPPFRKGRRDEVARRPSQRLMYTKIFLRARAARARAGRRSGAAGRARGAADRPAGRDRRATFSATLDSWRPGSGRLLVQLPGEHAGNHRPREGARRRAAGLLRLRRRAQRVVRRPTTCSSTARARSIAC